MRNDIVVCCTRRRGRKRHDVSAVFALFQDRATAWERRDHEIYVYVRGTTDLYGHAHDLPLRLVQHTTKATILIEPKRERVPVPVVFQEAFEEEELEL